MCVAVEFIPQALGVGARLWHRAAPVKYLRLMVSLGCELLPEEVAIYQKMHLIFTRGETKDSCPFSGLGIMRRLLTGYTTSCRFLLLGQELVSTNSYANSTHKVKRKQWVAVSLSPVKRDRLRVIYLKQWSWGPVKHLCTGNVDFKFFNLFFIIGTHRVLLPLLLPSLV